jgi:hypothetical protein
MAKATEFDAHIGRNVRTLRVYWQMKQADIAARMVDRDHVWTQQTVCMVETGQRPLLLTEAHTLAGVFGTSVEKLVSEIPL